MYAYIIKESHELTFIPKNSVRKVVDKGLEWSGLEYSQEKFNNKSLIFGSTLKDLLKKKSEYEEEKLKLLDRKDVKVIKEIILKYYDESLLDIQPLPKEECVAFIIKLENLIVSTENQSHNAGTVYVCLKYSYPVGIFGIRADKVEYTAEEMRRGYVHSHIPVKVIKNVDQVTGNKFTAFCTGTDTFPYRFSMKSFNFNKKEDLLFFESFVVYIQTLFSHESTDGVPYVRISSFYSSEYEDSFFTYENIVNLASKHRLFRKMFEDSLTFNFSRIIPKLDLQKTYTKFSEIILEFFNNPYNNYYNLFFNNDDVDRLLKALTNSHLIVYSHNLTSKQITEKEYLDLPDSESIDQENKDSEVKVISVSKRPYLIFKKKPLFVKYVLRNKNEITKKEPKTAYKVAVVKKFKEKLHTYCQEFIGTDSIAEKLFYKISFEFREERLTYHRRTLLEPIRKVM